mgnify:CR=1 FL=1
MDKESTCYGAGVVVISRAENGYIVTLRLWDNEVKLVSETFDGVVGILRRVDWSTVWRGAQLGKVPEPPDLAESPDEATGIAARSLRA